MGVHHEIIPKAEELFLSLFLFALFNTLYLLDYLFGYLIRIMLS